MSIHHPLSRLRRPQGAALIAVLLLTMVLSAVGIVAMQNTFSSLQLSGNYKLRTQAQETADAAMTFRSVRCGDRPVNCLGRLRAARTVNPDVSGVIATRDEMLADSTLQAPAVTRESGLLNGPTLALASHEADPSVGRTDFEVVLRDPAEGPPPPGSDGAFCSTKVYMGSRATYDALEVDGAGRQRQQNWARPPRAASGMLGMEAWVGPVPCNGGGGSR